MSSEPPAKFFVNQGLVTSATDLQHLLRPILKQWLDDYLPHVVDEHVKREINRITNKPV